jgi:serine/threonine protein kinase
VLTFLRSIGCMSIELVTGEPPFCNLNDIECLFKMSEKEPPPLPEDVSGKCRDFLSRCLEPEWRTVLFIILEE